MIHLFINVTHTKVNWLNIYKYMMEKPGKFFTAVNYKSTSIICCDLQCLIDGVIRNVD